MEEPKTKISSPRDLLRTEVYQDESITLGYTLPELACKALGISNLRVYASIQTRSTLPAILDWILKLPWVVHWYKV